MDVFKKVVRYEIRHVAAHGDLEKRVLAARFIWRGGDRVRPREQTFADLQAEVHELAALEHRDVPVRGFEPERFCRRGRVADVRDAQLHLARVQLVGQVPDGVFRIRHGGCVFQLFAARLGDAACAADVFQKALDSDAHFAASFAAIASSTALAAALPLVICGPCPSPATACAPANSSPSMK